MTKTMIWKCPNCWTEYEIDEKFADALKNKKDCKFCVRKDPNVPTTAEMDGLETPEEMRDRFFIMKQCSLCAKWTKQDTREPDVSCQNCGGNAFDIQGTKSLRTYDPVRDAKRKPQQRGKKK